MRQSELINRFLGGEETGRASNLEIRRIDETRIGLVGYETMLYAEYDESNHQVVIYTDWQNTTPKVKKHIQTIAAQAGSNPTEHRTESGMPLIES